MMQRMDDPAPARGRPGFLVSALLLDLDGVLVDSITSVERVWRGWAEEMRLDAEAVLEQMHGRPTAETIRRCASSARVRAAGVVPDMTALMVVPAEDGALLVQARTAT